MAILHFTKPAHKGKEIKEWIIPYFSDVPPYSCDIIEN